MTCPTNSVRYNTSLCACAPGYLYKRESNACVLFTSSTTISASSGVDYYTISFPETIFSFDTIKKFTQSQAVFLEATAVLLLSWFAFCMFMRLSKVRDGNSLAFHIRWWISRLDICFATRHWLEDQKVVKKRKTELGGTLSIASWILFTGLFAALLYQMISKRSIEVHNVRATNAPDLASFNNDMEFNITTISSMSCANLQNLGTLVTGTPGLFDYRTASLSSFANFSCLNTSQGPVITLSCNNCQLVQDSYYISWQFVDVPNGPAAAVAFQFNLSAKPHASTKHVSFVSGTLRNGSTSNDKPVTYRGTNTNIIKFNLFPKVYHNLHDLSLIQPLFHDFVPGSTISDVAQLQASLSNGNGIVNTTILVNFLSSYIVEIDNQSILGPVSFLADLGGLYCISIGIFYYLLVQCEYRIKKLRTEDMALRRIRNRRKAQEHWDKLRKYVMYTWGCNKLEDRYDESKMEKCCSKCMMQPIHRSGSLRTGRSSRTLQRRIDSINHNRKTTTPSKQITAPDCILIQGVKTAMEASPSSEHKVSSTNETSSAADGKQTPSDSHNRRTTEPQAFLTADDQMIPPPPPLELNASSQMDLADVQKNLVLLYEYNMKLREKFLTTQSILRDMATRSSSSTLNQK